LIYCAGHNLFSFLFCIFNDVRERTPPMNYPEGHRASRRPLDAPGWAITVNRPITSFLTLKMKL